MWFVKHGIFFWEGIAVVTRWLVRVTKLVITLLLIVVHRSIKLIHLRLAGIRVMTRDLIRPLHIRIFLRFKQLVDKVDFLPHLILMIMWVDSWFKDLVNSELDSLDFSRCGRGHHNVRIVVQDKLKLVTI